MNDDLYQYSIDQLAANHGSWPEIARQCDVSYSWLCKFARRKIPDASYAKVKRLAELLEAKAAERVLVHKATERREKERRERERRTKDRQTSTTN